MLKEYSLKALQIAINQAIQLDDQLPVRLKELNSKVIEILLSPLNVGFFIEFRDGVIQLLAHHDAPADTVIQSSPMGLIRLSILPASKARSLFNDSIRISGDTELGQRVKKIFDSIDIDWENHLARFTGDIAAYQIGRFVRKSLSFKQTIDESMRLNVTEYLQEELRLTPSVREINDFFQDVDDLSLDVERLHAHLNHLISLYEKN